MPPCKNCGLIVNESDNYCVSCGTFQREIMMANGIWPVKFPGKHSTNFFNGIRFGLFAFLVFGGLFWWLWLNNEYWSIRSSLITSGLEVQQVNYILSDMAGLISGCVLAVTVGIVLLIYVLLMQFSPVMNSLIGNNRNAKYGFNFALIGAMALGWSFSDYISYYNYHSTTHFPSSGPSPLIGILGAVLLGPGILLTIYAYTKSRKSVTKV
jgi:hypothetical protein